MRRSYTQQGVNLGFSLGELCALGVILSHAKFAKNAEKNFHYLNIEALLSIFQVLPVNFCITTNEQSLVQLWN